jgi:hypothetical protein
MIDRRILEQFAQIQRQFSDPAFQRFIADVQKAVKPAVGDTAKIARAIQPAIEQHAKVARGAVQAMQSAQFKDMTRALEAAQKASAEFEKAQNKLRADLRTRAKALKAANEAMDRAIRDSRALGLSYRDIAKESGFSHEGIRRILLIQRDGKRAPGDE